MKVKLKKGKVIKKSVWPAESVVDVDPKLAKKWIEAGDAEAVAATSSQGEKGK